MLKLYNRTNSSIALDNNVILAHNSITIKDVDDKSLLSFLLNTHAIIMTNTTDVSTVTKSTKRTSKKATTDTINNITNNVISDAKTEESLGDD